MSRRWSPRGFSGSLSRAPMYAAAGTLPVRRATTGSAMLNVSGQFGSAIGVYVLVALTANHTPFRGFDHVWIVQARLGLAAAAVLLTRSRHRTADLTANHPQPKGAR